VRAVDLPPPFEDGKPRMYVRYELETPGGPLALVVVHPFSPRHAIEDGGQSRLTNDAALRERQIAAAVESARSAGTPFVIAGDTNLPPGSSIARRRFAGLHDAFDDVGNGFGFTFPAKRPWMRIDRFLAGGGVRFLSIATSPLGPSDHRAVETELEIVGAGG
jgi:vancomycin resistance protein VanJ